MLATQTLIAWRIIMKKTISYSLFLLYIFLYGCESFTNAEKAYRYNDQSITATEIKNYVEQIRQERPKREAEMHFHRISENIPGFGGFYINDHGDYVIVLTDDAPQGLARSLAAQEIRRQKHNIDSESIIIKEGQFGFSDLATWRELVSGFVLTNDDFSFVRSSYIDEEENRIIVGIAESKFSEINIDNVKKFIVGVLSIPLEAVIFRETVTPALLSWTGSLYSTTRPLIGGLGIHKGAAGGACTMGFVGILDGHETFITNSHCTSTTFGLDNTTFFQGFTSSDNIVGSEYKDSNTSWCGMWPPWQSIYNCRMSDASAIKINSGIQANRGLIARTTFKNNTGGSGSTTINESNPVFSIAKSDDYIAQGTIVSKIGRETGWTEGKIIKTCVDKTYPGSEFWILKCQYAADFYADYGDSGSPVFRQIYSADGSEYISLYGIVYMKSSGEIYFSPMSGIRSDLGYVSANNPNSDYVAPPPNNGGGGGVIVDPCEENPLNCHQH